MANKLPWFKHSANASSDPLIYGLMNDFGHFGYAAYFLILELIHSQGRGDVLKITPQQLCFVLRTKPKCARNYLETIRERSRNKIETKWDDSRNEVIIEVKNFRKWQHNLNSKSGSNADQKRIEGEGEGEGEGDKPPTPFLDRNLGMPYSQDFSRFYEAYPKHFGKEGAWQAWRDLAPSKELVIKIMVALANYKTHPTWLEEGGKYIPNPEKWLRGRRWEDDISVPEVKPEVDWSKILPGCCNKCRMVHPRAQECPVL